MIISHKHFGNDRLAVGNILGKTRNITENMGMG